jgi:tetratricopeptide (TPR) repeat protein
VEEPAREPGTFDRAPPRALLVGVAAGLGLLLVVGAGLVAWRKLGHRAPPPAAVETLSAAHTDADKDTLASIASAEAKARDALEVAGPRARFPEASATLARVEIQWADALNDQASHIAEKNADDPRAAQLQGEAKGKIKAAFELLSPVAKANADSPDVQLAFADYYRAKRLPSSMKRYLDKVKDAPRAALIEALALLQEDDGAEKAIPRLKAALATNPQSARIHYRLAQAHLAAKDEASARAELKETLRISPQHERAQALLEQLGGGAEKK